MESLPLIVISGASGFLGRRVLDLLKSQYKLIAIDLRSQSESGVPKHPNISWHQFDICNEDALEAVCNDVHTNGDKIHSVIHLAAYYDFTGENHPEYQRTNLDGLRNMLEQCRLLKPKRFIFASSLAACEFPPPGQALTEESPADGQHPYAESKRRGEEMLREYADDVPSAIIRFAAMYSDWCEYPPLFVFLETWLSNQWNSRILGGKGDSAVPYLHVRDGANFLRKVVEKADELERVVVLNASTNGAVTHQQLFEVATSYYYGQARKPIHIPKFLAGPGVVARDALGRLLGKRPFERPWMAKFIDLRLTADASHTQELLGWQPHPRLDILQRVPFLIENMKTDPVEWSRRNQEAMVVTLRPNLRIYRLLEAREDEIAVLFTGILVGERGQNPLSSYQALPADELDWHTKVIIHTLMTSVRNRQKGILMAYCRDVAELRCQQGFACEEVASALAALNHVCIEVLENIPDSGVTDKDLNDYITTTITFSIDQVQEIFEYMQEGEVAAPSFRYQDQLWRTHHRDTTPPTRELEQSEKIPTRD
jgi:nucleoside-diphosphate-sugar epimerase